MVGGGGGMHTYANTVGYTRTYSGREGLCDERKRQLQEVAGKRQ